MRGSDRGLQPTRDELRSLILGLLARREMYGLEVATALQAHYDTMQEGHGESDRDPGEGRGSATIRGDEGPRLPEGSVYPALRRLEREGFATAHWVEIGEGVPRRRYYVLTPKGQRAVSPEAATVKRAARRNPGAARP